MGRGWVRGGCIGKGSFGTVSLACDNLDGRIFAVKSVPLDSDSIESLENEIEILRSLDDSSCIVAYLGDSTAEGWRNLHMEYVPGGTLADAAGSLCEPQVRAYTRCIAQALSYLHSVAGVVHSDVKGRNVLLGPAPGLGKLADFGSARRASDCRPAVGGTPLWMAPEVVRGSRPAPESDIWSLGCTVVEMVTGAHPWKSSAGHDKLFEIGFGDGLPEFPDQLSKSGADFLSKCLRRNPAERWTAEQLLQHPFLADTAAASAGAETERSPRSVLDRFSSEFDNDEAEDDENHDDDDVADLARERISQLTGSSESGGWDWDWDGEGEGWQVVRYFDGGEENQEAEESGDLDEAAEASGSGLSNGETRCSQQVGRVRKERSLDLCEVLFHVIIFCLVNANPVFFNLVLRLFRFLYRLDELRFLNL